MSEAFWNLGEKTKIKGLDVLGYRRYDQALEQRWVAGITTISFRARYLSMLPWILREYFESKLKSAGDTASYDENEFKLVLRRFEMVVLLATLHDGTGLRTYGVLGSDLYSEHEQAITDSGQVEAESERGGSVLNTYIMPCRAFGILAAESNFSALPVAITRIGEKLHESRAEVSAQSKLLDIILNGGKITRAALEREAHWYSVNTLESIEHEARLLRSVYTEKPEGVDVGMFDRFQLTLIWALHSIEISTDYTSTEVLNHNYRNVIVQRGAEISSVEYAWFEYELLRRIHLSSELLLQAFVQTLIDRRKGTVNEIVEEWKSESNSAPVLKEIFGWSSPPWTESLARCEESLEIESFLEDGVEPRQIRIMEALSVAVFAIGLLLVTMKQYKSVSSEHSSSIESTVVPRLLVLIERFQRESMETFLVAVLKELVVGTHLHNAMRKMAAGGECTLRFYEEGEELRATGLEVLAGRSGDRLSNVFGHLADLGFAIRESNASFILSDLGKELLRSREVLA
ncbi:MAG: hypothetical protein CL946_03565 [Ectothiorhodospiraceae bacterium]|nr:hypothetical protein [Ectothiorhodospiraceae bacterium]